MSWFRWDGDDLLLWLRVQPKASRDAFAEPQPDALRVRITAPPIDGKANTYLQRWLAKQFGVSRSRVAIETGDSHRNKRVRIKDPDKLPDALQSLIQLESRAK